MEIGGNNKSYPGGHLSNFTGNRFIFQDVECYSMEGFLQSLKFKEPHIQIEVCKLVGKSAKHRGSKKNWKRFQILYWKGKEYKRDSSEYQALLDAAYKAMFDQCPDFRSALAASGKAVFKHSIGKSDIRQTVLTESEFCSRLMKLRSNLTSK